MGPSSVKRNWLTKCSSLRTALLALACLATTSWSTAAEPSDTKSDTVPETAFYYGSDVPVTELGLYDRVVIDARTASPKHREALANTTELFCYLSIGETERSEAVNRKLIVGSNPGWDSNVMDVTSKHWRRALVKRAGELAKLGCEGLFLDTLDSYQLGFKEKDWPQAEQGLVSILKAFKETHPDLALFMNRGFEIFPEVADLVSHMAVESLYRGWNADAQKYRQIPADDREWLLGQLERVSAKGIPVTIIDYLPVSRSDADARALAQKIKAHGFSAWVTDLSLYNLGVSGASPEARHVLLLYSSLTSDWAGHDAHILLGAPLDYLGYRVQAVNVANGLPKLIQGVHAGVITWVSPEELRVSGTNSGYDMAAWEQWFLKANTDGYPLVMMGSFPVDSQELAQRMGIELQPASVVRGALKVNQAHEGVGDFEAPVPVNAQVSQYITNLAETNDPWLQLQAPESEIIPIMTGLWGGYALNPFLLQRGFNSERRWVLDPFAFLAQALHHKPRPVLDTTTENGRRILLSWVDGDGFPSRAEVPNTPFSAEVLLNDVFRPIKLPHTVSVIEGEVGEEGLYPELSDELESLARQIFELPNVEIASHSYSHPFFWARRGKISEAKTLYGLGLPIKGYKIDLRREIIGSIDYINEQLAPKSKKTEVFLWTGDAVPDDEAIALTREAGVTNLNGGNTQIRKAMDSLTNVYPQSRHTAGGLQVYAPIMNENVYTNNWTGPYWGFRKVIESFELTELPRRLKPLAIYYHFYSGTKRSALNALLEIYEYVQQQPNNPMYVSDFAKRVQGFESARFVQLTDKTWRVHNLGELRQVRIPKSMGWPDLTKSQQVVGVHDSKAGRFIHLSADDAELHFQSTRPKQPYLESANGTLRYWRKSGRDIELSMSSYVPLELRIHSTRRCRLERDGLQALEPAKIRGALQTFTLTNEDLGHALLVCR